MLFSTRKKTTVDVHRRAFLRGKLRGAPCEIRPPWAVDGDSFFDLCSGCGDCLSACEEHIIVKGGGGYPVVDFNRGECTFCGDCVSHCDSGALSRERQRSPWLHRARISDGCMTSNNIICRSCQDVCEPEAIRFELRAGGTATPVIDVSACNGCGACIKGCPSKAISLIAGDVGNKAPVDFVGNATPSFNQPSAWEK